VNSNGTTTFSTATFTGTFAKISEGDRITFEYDGVTYTATIGSFTAGDEADAVTDALVAAVSSNGLTLGLDKLTASNSSGDLVITADVTGKNITAATYIDADAYIVTSTSAGGGNGATMTIADVKDDLEAGFTFDFSYQGQTFTATLGPISDTATDPQKLAVVQEAINTALSGAVPLGFDKVMAVFDDDDLVLTAGTIGDTPATLTRGDLVINGIEIRAALASDDNSFYGNTTSSNRLGSAIAIAAAINANTALTGVRAEANPTTILGQKVDDLDALAAGTTYNFYINGTAISVLYSGEENEDWLLKLADRVNTEAANINVMATAGKNGLNLTAKDGRNLSVWSDTSQITAAQLGLANSTGFSAVAGVSGEPGAGANWNGATTVYATVNLISEKAFTVAPGTNGYKAVSNFTKLGFNEGTFGGTVNEADSKMSPPRTGRLTFHVGASATQTINIDFADYGAKGPITGDITSDVENWNNEKRTNRIDNAESARAVLANIDNALDKVNGNRAVMGAVMNRLDYIMENLSNVSMNTSASRSQIEDADYAKASTELARTGIMQQAATAILAQANMDQQTVLKLLG
jgi:flagellin